MWLFSPQNKVGNPPFTSGNQCSIGVCIRIRIPVDFTGMAPGSLRPGLDRILNGVHFVQRVHVMVVGKHFAFLIFLRFGEWEIQALSCHCFSIFCSPSNVNQDVATWVEASPTRASRLLHIACASAGPSRPASPRT